MVGGLLRLHFGPQDLLRTRMVTRPDPMWELVLSLHALRDRSPGSVHEPWRRQVLPRLRDNGLDRATRILYELVPVHGRFPDFLTPAAAEHGLAAGLEMLLALPVGQVSADLATARPRSAPPTWMRQLASGDREARGQLVSVLRAYFDAVVRPYWSTIYRQVVGDQVVRAQGMTTHGVDRLLSGLPPPIRWRWPVLEAGFAEDHDIRLNGRGLVLIPSYFCVGTPVTLMDPALPPVLVYPARMAAIDQPPVEPELAPVLGRTRARLLYLLRDPCSTSELAQRSGISLASASQQAGALRQAGLISTVRDGQSVRHALTPLGRELVAPSRLSTFLTEP